MKVVTVKFGGPKGGGSIKSGILWKHGIPSCDEQKDCPKDNFFSLACIGVEANFAGKTVHRQAKDPFVERECLVIQRDFQE